MAWYQSYNKKWWKGRVDGKSWEHLRWHQFVKALDFQRVYMEGIALLGFSSDEGIRRSGGRLGAVEGPEHIQRAMSDLAVHFQVPLYDAGNVLCDSEDLEAAQKLLALKVAEIHKTGCLPIVIGGGHEMAWGHFQGLVRAFPDDNIGIVNIDAHFDLEAPEKPNSRSSFRQIADFQEARNGAFNYLVFGIQRPANTRHAFNTAENLEVTFFTDTDVRSADREKMNDALDRFISDVDGIYLTIDLDVFHNSHAPGVSDAGAAGIYPDNILSFLKKIAASGKLRSIDLAEVSPRLDPDGRTSRLAAYLAFELITALDGA